MEGSRIGANGAAEETLDPADWGEALALSRRIVEDAVGYLRDVRERPVWREMPEDVRAFFAAPLPRTPEPLADVYREVVANVMAYPMGNTHPRFWSWYMGSSNFTGAIGDFLAAIQGSNLGGGNHAAALMDRQVVDWCKEMIGFPASAGGTLVSGGSMANIVGLTVARNAKAGVDVREHGVAAMEKPLRFYGSDQIHSCHRKAMEALGLGNQGPATRSDRRRAAHRPLGATRGDRGGPRGRLPTGMRHRNGRDGQHRRDRRFAGSGDPGGARGPLVSCRRLHRRADRRRAGERVSRRRNREGELGRARSPQVAPRAVRSRLRAGPGRRGASRRFCGDAGISGIDPARPGLGRLAARLRLADLAGVQGAQDLDVAQGAWRREVRPPDRPEHRAGGLSQRSDRGRAPSGIGRADEHQHRLLSLSTRRHRWSGAGRRSTPRSCCECRKRASPPSPTRRCGASIACARPSTITGPAGTIWNCWSERPFASATRLRGNAPRSAILRAVPVASSNGIVRVGKIVRSSLLTPPATPSFTPLRGSLQPRDTYTNAVFRRECPSFARHGETWFSAIAYKKKTPSVRNSNCSGVRNDSCRRIG